MCLPALTVYVLGIFAMSLTMDQLDARFSVSGGRCLVCDCEVTNNWRAWNEYVRGKVHVKRKLRYLQMAQQLSHGHEDCPSGSASCILFLDSRGLWRAASTSLMAGIFVWALGCSYGLPGEASYLAGTKCLAMGGFWRS